MYVQKEKIEKTWLVHPCILSAAKLSSMPASLVVVAGAGLDFALLLAGEEEPLERGRAGCRTPSAPATSLLPASPILGAPDEGATMSGEGSSPTAVGVVVPLEAVELLVCSRTAAKTGLGGRERGAERGLALLPGLA